MQNFIADTIEKVLIMRYNEKRLLPCSEIVVKPNDGVKIKMICRLVEHKLDE